MLKKSKKGIDFVDSKIVKEGFIVAEGFNVGQYDFLDKEKNPFGRNLWVPIFYTFKVHRNHSLNVSSSGINHINIYPVNEDGKKNSRMPAEVYRDKMAYDLTTFVLVPYVTSKSNRYWKKFGISDGFVSDKGKLDISLLYLEHGNSLHSQDSLIVSEVIPSQLAVHFFYWLKESKEIISHEKTFGCKLEGRVEVPLKRARTLTAEVINLLEKRYDSRLAFESYKKQFPAIFNIN